MVVGSEDVARAERYDDIQVVGIGRARAEQYGYFGPVVELSYTRNACGGIHRGVGLGVINGNAERRIDQIFRLDPHGQPVEVVGLYSHETGFSRTLVHGSGLKVKRRSGVIEMTYHYHVEFVAAHAERAHGQNAVQGGSFGSRVSGCKSVTDLTDAHQVVLAALVGFGIIPLFGVVGIQSDKIVRLCGSQSESRIIAAFDNGNLLESFGGYLVVGGFTDSQIVEEASAGIQGFVAPFAFAVPQFELHVAVGKRVALNVEFKFRPFALNAAFHVRQIGARKTQRRFGEVGFPAAGDIVVILFPKIVLFFPVQIIGRGAVCVIVFVKFVVLGVVTAFALFDGFFARFVSIDLRFVCLDRGVKLFLSRLAAFDVGKVGKFGIILVLGSIGSIDLGYPDIYPYGYDVIFLGLDQEVVIRCVSRAGDRVIYMVYQQSFAVGGAVQSGCVLARFYIEKVVYVGRDEIGIEFIEHIHGFQITAFVVNVLARFGISFEGIEFGKVEYTSGIGRIRQIAARYRTVYGEFVVVFQIFLAQYPGVIQRVAHFGCIENSGVRSRSAARVVLPVCRKVGIGIDKAYHRHLAGKRIAAIEV